MHTSTALEDIVFHLGETGAIGSALKTTAFWTQRDRVELVTGRVLAVFSYEATWDFQERHPDGDELAVVLEGEIDLLLDEGEGERAVRLASRQAGIVPRGVWHRVAVLAPSTILFVTPVPARTEHRAAETSRRVSSGERVLRSNG